MLCRITDDGVCRIGSVMSRNDVPAGDQRSRSDSHRARHDIAAVIDDQSTTVVDAVVTGELTLAQLTSFVESADSKAESVDPALVRMIEIVASLLADRRSDEQIVDQQVDSMRSIPE